MTIDLASLNDNQRRAVLWNDGPLLVLAGPGSGKTQVLTFRVARLLDEFADASVLALTFTEKAAAEMRERVDSLLGQRGERTHLCTFHSFACDILRQHGSHVGIRPDFSLLTHDDDRVAVLQEAVQAIASTFDGIPSDRKNLLALVDRLFAESYDGEPSTSSIQPHPEWLPRLFEGYLNELKKLNRLDFGSLLLLARRLLVEKPAVRRIQRVCWSHVCVDEFQDTNKAQYDLLRQLVSETHPNLFVVGDDDQILYQWNGASPERLIALRRDFPEIELVQLPENYRCPPQIVALANQLIVHNRNRTPNKQPLIAAQQGVDRDDVVRYGSFSTPDEEIAAVVNDIKRRQLGPADCVILARTTKLLEAAATALRNAGFEAFVAQRKNDFTSPLVQVVINALRLANARHDRDLLRKLCAAWDALTGSKLEVESLIASAALNGGDFLKAWATSVRVCPEAMHVELVNQIEAALVSRLEVARLVNWFLDEGWKEPSANERDQELVDEIQTWHSIHEEIAREYDEAELTLSLYLQRMDLAPKTNRPCSDAIRCMTVHGSKGMQFKHVYLIGMAQEVLPSFQSLRRGPASVELEEERRNCFVAITRAQQSLTLTRANTYSGWSKKPSQFLREMGLVESGS